MRRTTRSAPRSGSCSPPTTRPQRRELARITKPGGRIALANWTPGTGGVQDLFKVMLPFQPAPPPSSPFDWGDEAKVRELLEEAFDLTFDTRMNTVTYDSVEDYWQDFSQNYGPTKIALRVAR